MRPSLILLAGPSRAGKSTLYQTRIAPSFAGPFIDEDLIQWDELRDARKSFVTETVCSHPSKLDIITDARKCGYIIIVMHVGMDSSLAVVRVRHCKEGGGRDVPEDKIWADYDRGQSFIRQAVLLADRGMVFDNSKLNTSLRLVLLFATGRLVQAEPVLPSWVVSSYAQKLVI
jgi:predicted ABC-type ATPase